MRFLSLLAFLAFAVVLGCQSTALTSARLYLQQGDTAKAKEQLLKAAELTPADPEVHLELARIYGQQGDFAAMVAALARCQQLGPRLADQVSAVRHHYWATEYNRGVILATAAQPDLVGARTAFEGAIGIDSTALQSWRNLAFAQYRLGDISGAIGSYQRLQALAPADTAVLSNLGSLCAQQERYDDAVLAFERLTQLSPGDCRAQVNLGAARERAAEAAYRRAVETAGDSAVASCIKQSFVDDGQPLDDAIQAFDQMSDRSSAACRAQVNLGVTLERSAESAYRRAIELAPDAASAHLGLGGFLYKQGRYEGARDAYIRATVLVPTDVDARYNLAMTYLRLTDDDHALALLEPLSTETPDNGSIWRQLSLIYARKERLADSKAAEARARDLGEWP